MMPTGWAPGFAASSPNTSSASATWRSTPGRATAIPSPSCCPSSAPGSTSRSTGLAVSDLTSTRVLQFLAHLEESRGCSVQTRNQRLTAIRAFASFVGGREPTLVEWCGNLRSIPLKKGGDEAGRLADQARDRRHASRSPTARSARPERVRPAAVPLQHGRSRLGATQLRMADMQISRTDGGHALVT